MAQRIIKFRGKHIETGEWLYGSHYDDGGEQYILPNNILSVDIHDECQVDPATVGEYTGLTDKWGNGVYEGDILRIREYKNMSFGTATIAEEDEMREVFTLEELKGELWAESVSPVCWEESMFLVSIDWENDTYFSCLWGDMKKSQPIFDFEVIGNVYDNPDIQMKLSDRHKKKEE